MKYRKKKRTYKYVLVEDEHFWVGVHPVEDIDTKFIALSTVGHLIVKANYAWDGASGPTKDTPSSMRGSLGHDALYQLLREGRIDSFYRRQADDHLYQWLLEDGMNSIRAWFWHRAVIEFAAKAAQPCDDEYRVYEAP